MTPEQFVAMLADKSPPQKHVIVFDNGVPVAMYAGGEEDVTRNVAKHTGDGIELREPTGTRWLGVMDILSIPVLEHFDLNWAPPR